MACFDLHVFFRSNINKLIVNIKKLLAFGIPHLKCPVIKDGTRRENMCILILICKSII